LRLVLRELFNLIELLALCQTLFIVFFRPARGRPNILLAVVPRLTDSNLTTRKPFRIRSVRFSANLSNNDQHRLSPLEAHEEFLPRVLQWLVL
jgi:hypothetical protein